MMQYILEVITFHLIFLVIFDFWLKRETFFQWNRMYLIGTYILSMVLPLIKIEAFKTTVPEQYYVYPEFLWKMNGDQMVVTSSESSDFFLSWQQVIFFGGMFFATFYFVYKLLQVVKLRKEGSIEHFPRFTRIIVKNSDLAFSFFKSIFLGDKVIAREHQSIIQHELVHIEQRHSCDLVFFELMRIVGWFNPLVYVYQSRISELHEFIADAKVAKTHRNEQYESLLSQVFQTENISFINQFFKTSLLKKRIVMLQKRKSKNVWQFKYLLLVPLVLGMLVYTSCELEKSFSEQNRTMVVDDIQNMSKDENERLYNELKNLSSMEYEWEFTLKDENATIRYNSAKNNSFIKFEGYDERINATMTIIGPDIEKESIFGIDRKGKLVPFVSIDEVPIFPGCEEANDKRACFNQKMQKHISKNFKYPKEAQEQGIQGKVSVMFTIDQNGNIFDIRKRGPHTLLEQETERIISRLPKMVPGKHKGKEVNVPFSIPIAFRLQTSDSDEGYERLKKEQIDRLPEDIQFKYKNAVPFAMVENVPIFPGCEDASDQRACFQSKVQMHISKHFRYPQEAQEKGIQGRVNIMFIIDLEGNITNIAKRGPDTSLEAEAQRIISKLPKMQPGEHHGKNVNVPFSIPITFKLQ